MTRKQTSWRVPDGAGLRWRSWDGDHVLYHGASGDTHHVSAVAAAALRYLETQPAGIEQLSRHLERQLGLEAGPEFVGQLEQMLGRFDELGLVEVVS